LIGALSEDQTVKISFPLADVAEQEGTIISVSQAASPGRGLFPVRIALPEAEGLRPGLPAPVRLPAHVRAADRLMVPLSAVVSPSGEQALLHRVSPDNRIEPIAVELIDVEMNQVQVRGSISAGDRVVVRGHIGLSEGDMVAPVTVSSLSAATVGRP